MNPGGRGGGARPKFYYIDSPLSVNISVLYLSWGFVLYLRAFSFYANRGSKQYSKRIKRLHQINKSVILMYVYNLIAAVDRLDEAVEFRDLRSPRYPETIKVSLTPVFADIYMTIGSCIKLVNIILSSNL